MRNFLNGESVIYAGMALGTLFIGYLVLGTLDDLPNR